MIETEEDVQVSEQKDSRIGSILNFFTVFILISVLIGVSFVIYKRENSEIKEKVENKNISSEKSRKEPMTLLELTTAPENNPDLKPNPELTALTTAPESMAQNESSVMDMERLTAPQSN